MRKTLTLLTLTLGLATGALADGGGWSRYEAAFEMFPCQDGWSACTQGEHTVGPDVQTDAAGLPYISGMRLSWFDLEPTSEFSPFVEFADRMEPRAAPVPETPVKSAADAVPALPDTTDGVVLASKPTLVEAPDPDAPVDTPDPVETPEPVDVPEPEEAPVEDVPDEEPSVPPDPATPELDANAHDGSADAQIPDPPEPIVPDEVVTCEDPRALESDAVVGRLTPEQVQCLEERMGTTEKQSDRGKMSRVLMAQAFATGDKAEWARLLERHLQSITQSEPDLCYSYALHLSRSGGSPYETIRWADVAMENRSYWSGSTYVTRVNGLYKVRASASQKIWHSREAAYKADPTEQTKAAADDARVTTRWMAREWYEYASKTGGDSETALRLCESSGSRDFCKQQD